MGEFRHRAAAPLRRQQADHLVGSHFARTGRPGLPVRSDETDVVAGDVEDARPAHACEGDPGALQRHARGLRFAESSTVFT